jgi:hypothetical protein
MNKQLRTADKGWSPAGGLGVGLTTIHTVKNLRWPFEKLVDWQKCAAIMQREA